MMRTRRFWLWLLVGGALLLLLLGGRLAGLLTDLLWFDALGFGAAFVTRLTAEALLALGVTLGAWGFLYLNLRVALARTPGRPLLLPGQVPGGVLSMPATEAQLRRTALLVSLGAASLLGLVALGRWPEVLLAINGEATGVSDPVFGRDLSLFLFWLPLVPWVKGTLWLLGFFTIGLVGAVYLLRREVVAVTVEGAPVPLSFGRTIATSGVRGHLGLLLAGALLLLAVGYWIDRYLLLFDQQGLFAGPGYAGIHGELPLLAAAAITAALAGVGVLVAARRGKARPAWVGFGLLGVVWLLLTFVPTLMQRLLVDPNELERERPFLTRHIDATNQAYGLATVSERVLSGEAGLDLEAIQRNRGTINNVPLWDKGPLLETFEQLQEIRTYYEFVSVDNDRYLIDGELRQTMLSPRELLSESLPNRTWINEVLTFTHGHGLTLGPVNQISQEGLPELFVQDLPPKSSKVGLEITRPEIYFGEIASDHAFVSTGTAEFDYPSGDQNIFATYAGEGDVSAAGFWRRLLFAVRLGSIKVLLATDFNETTKLQLYRKIRDRVRQIAPFLHYDADPYMVIVEGRLYWIMDAYTVASTYPYSQEMGNGFNYIRNPVKITIDAYNGTTKFYLITPEEPLIKAWSKAFPSMFVPFADMPASIRSHLRHPEDYFSIQARVYATYHMKEPGIFYNKEDQWELPVVGDGILKPHYIVMKLPGAEQEEFILMLPFTPRRKDNLAAWMVARCDAPHLGELVAYRFPKHKLIFGPRQVQARINQDPEISRTTALWDQRGSKVLWGNLQVIPIEESLMYIQPLYIKAATGKIPELKRVIVGYQNSIAMEPTLEEALQRIFGERPEARPGAAGIPEAEGGLPAREAAAALAPTPAAPSGEIAPDAPTASLPLARQAWLRYQEAEAAARAGDWARYGERLGELKTVLRALAGEQEPPPGSDASLAAPVPAAAPGDPTPAAAPEDPAPATPQTPPPAVVP